MNILITGGCGFIGSHFVAHTLRRHPDATVTNLDALTYAAHPDTVSWLATIAPDRYHFVQGDIASPDVADILRERRIDTVVNFAAETHVDRSILDPAVFVVTNIKGVENLLSLTRKAGNIRLVHVSTDEVYGSLAPSDPPSTESARLDPNSPYAASKAAADLLALASHRTYGQEVLITRCTNNYGPFQFPEKFIPLLIANALEDLPIPVYGDGRQVRDWIYVEDHVEAVDLVMRKGKAGQIYNISASRETQNLDLVRLILKKLGKPETLIQHVGDRPAHDRRYGLDSSHIRSELGWKPSHSFEQGIDLTIDWYQKNQGWWKKLRDKDYYKYYAANYDTKFGAKTKREK